MPIRFKNKTNARLHDIVVRAKIEPAISSRSSPRAETTITAPDRVLRSGGSEGRECMVNEVCLSSDQLWVFFK